MVAHCSRLAPLLLFPVWLLCLPGCPHKKLTAVCGERECRAGEVCVDQKCYQVCHTTADCPDGMTCTADVCRSNAAEGAPRIASVDGNGVVDGAPGHTAHHTAGGLVILGENLADAEVRLSQGAWQQPLEVCQRASDRLLVELPPSLDSGVQYRLTVFNQAGTCDAVLPVLQGQQGPPGQQGPQGVAGPIGAKGDRGDAGGGIVLDLEFDETTTGVLQFADSSPWGAARKAVGVGGITGAAGGHSGRAVDFLTAGVVWIADPRVPDGANVWVEAWIKPDAPLTGERLIVAKTGAFALGLSDANLFFAVSVQKTPGSPCTVTSYRSTITTDGTWYHVAGWYDGLMLTVAINGRPQGVSQCEGGPMAATPAGAFLVGANYDGTNITEGFDGSIDEVRVRHQIPTFGLPGLIDHGYFAAAPSSYDNRRIPVEACTGSGCFLDYQDYDLNGLNYYTVRFGVQYVAATKTVRISDRYSPAWTTYIIDTTNSWQWWWSGATGMGDCPNPYYNAGQCNSITGFYLVSYNGYGVRWALYKNP